ncbi:unnamed protein product [Blumeria hordei]|uniref:Uncharacterized protein n=1 Tax=Blumeria hordei TaxID=2867405 RepID=A0A383UN40_BLUHO|nr:unnamed protein product [Blumeria hordei]
MLSASSFRIHGVSAIPHKILAPKSRSGEIIDIQAHESAIYGFLLAHHLLLRKIRGTRYYVVNVDQ